MAARKRLAALAMLLALVAIAPTVASAGEARLLMLEEAVKLAMANGKQLRISGMDAAAAHAKADEVWAANKPQLKAQASYSKLSDVGPFQIQPDPATPPMVVSPSLTNWYQAKLTLTYPLFSGFKLEGMARSAEYGAQAADMERENSAAQTLLAVRMAYWNLYKALEVKRVIDENVEQVRAHLADVSNRVNVGLLLRDEQLKVEVLLSNARFAQVEAVNNARLAAMALNSLTGAPLEDDVQPASAPPAGDGVLKTAEEYRAEAFDARPDLAAARMSMEAGRAAYSASKGGWLPSVSLFGDYTYARPNQRQMPNQDRWDSTWAAGVMVSYDLVDWGATRSQVAGANALQTRAEIVYDQARDGVELEVNQSYLNLLQSRERIAIAHAGVAQAEESARIAKNRFHNGQATNTEVLDAELALLQSRLNETIATADHAVALARLQKAAGQLAAAE